MACAITGTSYLSTARLAVFWITLGRFCIMALLPGLASAQGFSEAVLGDLFKAHWATQSTNDASEWAAQFAESSSYSHLPGKSASPATIRAEREILVQTYPTRKYSLSAPPAFEVADGEITFSYSYEAELKGVSTVHASAAVTVTARIRGNRILLTSYKEKIQPRLMVVNAATSTKLESQHTCRVVAIGGSVDGWHLAVSAAGNQKLYGQQQVLFETAWPQQAIAAAWKQGFNISGVAGDSRGWAVVLSRFKNTQRRNSGSWGPGDLNTEVFQTWFAESHAKGARITSIAGYGNNWVVVMSFGTGWGQQRFTRAGPYDNDWLKERATEGYEITTIAGDRRPDGSGGMTDSYVIVMARDAHHGAWTANYNVSSAHFTPWYKEKSLKMSPIALFGNRGSWGAAFGTTMPYQGCVYWFDQTAPKVTEWLNSLGIGLLD